MGRAKFIDGILKNAVPDTFDADVVADFFAKTPMDGDHPAIDVLTALSERRAVLDDGQEDADAPAGDGAAGAKPDFGSGKGGGGKGGDSDGGGGKGGGKGKGGTGGEEPAPEPSPDPTPEPEPEPEPTPTVDYISGLDTPGGFNIEIDYAGTWSASQKALLVNAAEQISDIILGDLPDHNGIDDIRITANMTSIDGAGGTWGIGGTNMVRTDSNLPSLGYITIDSADAGTAESYGLFEDLVFHEILHALGFGTTWGQMGLVDNFNGDLRFNGATATEVYNTQYAALADADPLSGYGVPLETDGGSLSAGKHWDEDTFNNDIMSTQLDWSNHISDLSVAALSDMGYLTVPVDDFLFL